MHKRCLFFFGWAAEHVCSARKQTRTVACSATYRKTYPWRLATVSAFTCAGAVVRSQTEYNSLYKARTLPGWFGCRYSSSMALCPNSSCQMKRSRKIFCERCSRSGPSNRTGVVAELTGVCEVMNHLAADSSGIWLAGPEHVNMGYNCEHGSESNFFWRHNPKAKTLISTIGEPSMSKRSGVLCKSSSSIWSLPARLNGQTFKRDTVSRLLRLQRHWRLDLPHSLPQSCLYIFFRGLLRAVCVQSQLRLWRGSVKLEALQIQQQHLKMQKTIPATWL